jgi:hypothetical protein
MLQCSPGVTYLLGSTLERYEDCVCFVKLNDQYYLYVSSGELIAVPGQTLNPPDPRQCFLFSLDREDLLTPKWPLLP